METTKTLVILTTIIGLSIISGDSHAQNYNKLIKNPFAFCSAPKPCKTCHPFRQIYEDICDGNKPIQVILPSPDLPATEIPKFIKILPSSEIPKPVQPENSEPKQEIEGYITNNVK